MSFAITSEECLFSTYGDLRVTTQTYVTYTNILINNEKLYNSIECKSLNFPLPSKKKMIVNPDENLAEGDIVFAEHMGKYKGQLFKKTPTEHMLNCITVIMKISSPLVRKREVPPKFYNIKISNKGVVQMTGCIDPSPMKFVIKNFKKLFLQDDSLFSYSYSPNIIIAYITPVMCNVGFAIPFEINREKLSECINTKTEFISLLEKNDGYVGVNIKIHSNIETIENTEIIKLTVCCSPYLKEDANKCSESIVKYSEYLNLLNEKERTKRQSKEIVNTFLVFFSGNTIMSGCTSLKNRTDAFEKFAEIITKFRREIEVIHREPRFLKGKGDIILRQKLTIKK